MIAAALADAYLATDYCVDLPDGERLVLHIGERCAGFEQALLAVGQRDWCIISAANPKSAGFSNRARTI